MTDLDEVVGSFKAVAYNSKNLKKDFRDFAKKLADIKGTEWTVRESLLKKIAGMGMAHSGDDREFAETLHKELGRVLAEQIEDLRSQIVKMACAVVVKLSEELEDLFNLTFELVLPSVIKQLPVKALPIRASADQCVRAVISHRTNAKIFRTFYNATTEKERIIREQVSDYFEYICGNWDEAVLQKNLSALVANLKPLLQDGHSPVREHSRQCMVQLADKFPRAMTEFLRDVDAKVVKLMLPNLSDEVKAELDAPSRAATAPGGLGVPQSNVNVRRSTGSTGRPPARPRVRGSMGSERNLARGSDPMDDHNSAMEHEVGMPRRAVSALPSQGLNPPRQQQNVRRGSAGGKAAAEALARMGNLDSNNAHAAPKTLRSVSMPQHNQAGPAAAEDMLERLQRLRAEVLNMSGARQ